MRKEKCHSASEISVDKNTEKYVEADMINKQKELPNLLLHSCCGPCSTAVIERLIHDYKITVFFYNPNITDKEEYLKRKEAQLKVIDTFNKKLEFDNKVGFLEGVYDTKRFYHMAQGMEDEPEGGKRCYGCFVMRLEETAQTASIHKFDTFATTLTVSPHKNYDIISRIGKMLAVKYKVGYLDGNFKKKDGFKRSIELSKEFELYRQNFCGCEYSVWE